LLNIVGLDQGEDVTALLTVTTRLADILRPDLFGGRQFSVRHAEVISEVVPDHGYASMDSIGSPSLPVRGGMHQ